MTPFIQRDWTRTEHDDFALRVVPLLGQWDGAVPVHDEAGVVLGWKIKPVYE